MKKVFEIQKKRVIDYVPVYSHRDDLVVYTDNLLEDGVLISNSQGVSFKKDVEAVVKEENIKFRQQDGYELCLVPRKEFRELVRTTLFGRIKEFPVIEEAYDFILKNGTLDEESEYEVVKHGGHYKHRSKTMNETFIPQAVLFDYMYSNGGIENERYNLKEILEVLKHRKDIIWLNSETRIKKGEVLLPEISKIPYYNATEDSTHQLDFLWTPSDEDFAKIAITDRDWKHHEIMKIIFGYDLEENKITRHY